MIIENVPLNILADALRLPIVSEPTTLVAGVVGESESHAEDVVLPW